MPESRVMYSYVLWLTARKISCHCVYTCILLRTKAAMTHRGWSCLTVPLHRNSNNDRFYNCFCLHKYIHKQLHLQIYIKYMNNHKSWLFALATFGHNLPVYNLINLGWLIIIFHHQYSSNQVWWTLYQCEENADYRILRYRHTKWVSSRLCNFFRLCTAWSVS